MKTCAVILDYRGAQKTSACLRSLAGQGLDCAVIVDNSADIRASMALEAAVDTLRQESLDLEMHLHRSPANLGFARGVNAGLQHVAARKCDTFLLLNNDATVAAGTIASLKAALAEPGVDLVAPVLIDNDGAQQPVFWYQRYLGIMSDRAMPSSFPYLSGCCLLFRRDLLEAGTLLDEEFFMYGEDVLLGWRLGRTGRTIRLVDNAIVRHAGVGSSRQCKLFYEYHTARAHVILAWKTRLSSIEVPALLLGKGIGLAMRAVVRSMRYRSVTPMLAFCLAWLPLDLRAP